MESGARSQESEVRRVGRAIQPADIDVVILCGGMGSRLKSVVADRPKPMAAIGQRPFLDILIDQFLQAGFRRFILCVGHMAEQIASHYRTAPAGIQVVISSESMPLGTAGAVKNAEPSIQSDPFLVANGDSFCPVDLAAFVRFHQARDAVLSMAVAPSYDPKDYGTVILDADRRMIGFLEKADTHTPGHINAGLYLFSRQVLAAIPEAVKTSLECDIFPRLIGQRCYAFMGSSPVLDIGTPERLAKTRQILSNS
jgi:NDP-sugar pyrophosphorylase family protein